jgi:hypothetical protein
MFLLRAGNTHTSILTPRIYSLTDMHSGLDGEESLKAESNDHRPSPNRIRKFCHSLGLESLYQSIQEFREHSPAEEKKIAILPDALSATAVSPLHIVPIGASITLIVFNWKGYYIGGELQGPVGENGLKLLGLQFAAKMLELLAMGSLSTILFALVRGQLISDTLPFGAITAGFEFNQLSLLWSKGFVATCATKFSSVRSKFILVTTIIIFTILGAVIGPSAAVAGQPVLQNWQAGGTVFWLNATSQALWPLNLDKAASQDLPCTPSQNASCPSSNYNIYTGELLSLWPSSLPAPVDGWVLPQVMPEKVLIPGPQSLQTLAVRFRGPFIYQPDVTTATSPSAAISDAVSQIGKYWLVANQHQCSFGNPRFCYYNDIAYTVDTIQPVTFVRCSAGNVNATVQFPRLDQAPGNYPLIAYNNTTIGSQQWFDEVTRNGSSVSWIELPDTYFGRSSVGVVIALPRDNTSGIPGQVFACTVDARWAPATTTVSFLGGPMIASGVPTDWLGGGQLQLNASRLPSWPQINITSEWGESINPIIAEPSESVFQFLCNSIARLDNILLAPSPINAVEAVLSVMITESLAQTSSAATILGSLKGLGSFEWMNEMFPQASVFGSGGSAFNYSYQDGDQSTKFEAKVTVNGYGNGITTATFLSTIVLVIYSLIAFIYVVCSIFFAKTTSSSWESIAELVALAVNSQPSAALHNTGAGIATLGTYKQPVGIRVSEDHLQMFFEEGGGEKVTPNECYG